MIDTECTVDDCIRRSRRRSGLCESHYRGFTRQNKKNGPCLVDGCTDRSIALRYCGKHYQKYRVYGDATVSVRKRAKIGDTKVNNFGYVLQYQPDYPYTQEGKGWVMQHRYIMSQHLGRPLESHENVHHKNGNRADNGLENLELWIVRQHTGQRVEDLLEYADWIISKYRR